MAKEDVKAVDAEVTAPAKKGKTFYFRNTYFAGLCIQVQGHKENKATGEKEQFVAEEATFTQYYDTWKGDVIRVGYLATTSEKIAARCEEDLTCESISEKEYNEAVETLKRAPVPPKE